MDLTPIVLAFSFIIGLIAGGAAMFFFRRTMINRQIRIGEKKAARIEVDARAESKNVIDEAKREAERIKQGSETEYRERRSEFHRQEERLSQKGETLERKLDSVGQR